MYRESLVLLLIVLFAIGCNTNTEQVDSSTSTKPTSSELETSKDDNDSSRQGSVDNETAETTVERKDLDELIARYDDPSKWHYGERKEGELAGTWLSVDGDGNRVVFRADGTFSEDFNENMTEGLFAISDAGRIVTVSEWNKIRLTSHFTLDGDTITGPKGAIPNAKWKRSRPDK